MALLMFDAIGLLLYVGAVESVERSFVSLSIMYTPDVFTNWI